MGLCAKDGTDRVAIPPLRRDRCGSMVWVRCARGVAWRSSVVLISVGNQ
jgi:hypothetical protein